MNLEQNIRFSLENNFNILIIGKHGTAKTSLSEKVCQDLGLKSQYFSVSTLDPYVDLVGLPHVIDQDIPEPVVRFIRPEHLHWEDVEVLILDELNRAHPKVINTLFEVIQQKRINGVPIPKLKAVIGIANPDTDEYDTDRIDHALRDRFQVEVSSQAVLSEEFFTKLINPDQFRRINRWYTTCQDGKSIKGAPYISPRRIEYAIRVFQAGGDPSLSLPKGVNTTEFTKILSGQKDRYSDFASDLRAFANLKHPTEEQTKELQSKLKGNTDLVNMIVEELEKADQREEMGHVFKLIPDEFLSKHFHWNDKTAEECRERNNVLAAKIVFASSNDPETKHSMMMKVMRTHHTPTIISFSNAFRQKGLNDGVSEDYKAAIRFAISLANKNNNIKKISELSCSESVAKILKEANYE